MGRVAQYRESGNTYTGFPVASLISEIIWVAVVEVPGSRGMGGMGSDIMRRVWLVGMKGLGLALCCRGLRHAASHGRAPLHRPARLSSATRTIARSAVYGATAAGMHRPNGEHARGASILRAYGEPLRDSEGIPPC